MDAKRVSDSKTQQIQILMPADINGYNRLFGGKLMEWIDVVAAVVARRHSGSNVTTAAIDNLQFKEPAYVNDTIVLKGQITCVGRTSMEVRVDTYIESLLGKQHLINRAYLVVVAIDEHGKPTEVPAIVISNEQEQMEFDAGIARKEHRKQYS